MAPGSAETAYLSKCAKSRMIIFVWSRSYTTPPASPMRDSTWAISARMVLQHSGLQVLISEFEVEHDKGGLGRATEGWNGKTNMALGATEMTSFDKCATSRRMILVASLSKITPVS